MEIISMQNKEAQNLILSEQMWTGKTIAYVVTLHKNVQWCVEKTHFSFVHIQPFSLA